MGPHVAVIGAGIIGLSTAVLAQEKIPGLQVTIISDHFSPQTTGDGSAGLWLPYCLKQTPQSDILHWSSKTYNHMLNLWKSPEAGDVGVSLIPYYKLTKKAGGADMEQPEWTKVPVAHHIISSHQAQKLSSDNDSKLTGGVHFISFTLEPSYFLPYLLKKFKLNGGKVLHRKVENLHDLCGQQYDVVINCSGVQARNLVGDNSVQPVRGQVLRVKAPWVFHAVLEDKDEGNYIIPNEEYVVLGGTQQEGNWNTKPDPTDSIAIHKGCCKLIPGLKEAVIMKEWAGLRPGRPKVRLERECISDEYGNALEVIHNYGHGGSGVTLSWGCAHDVAEILQDVLYNHPSSVKLSSKL
ncbi:D-aspartate oxidase isoform X2 [Zootermopsis nevadensis]|uniref:D-aspartate oxidase n=1 Tax=Zootermopsis nevadensis TaxID=136037 RepID=A0A067RKT4_ZOONE|nr:D-aspartate oxidase isoform X1 [Zootermopsis nevadensis]XP_021918652.1 D-aspartate oxidase isoform X2 [Zootermopsis nevadensis]XP_021918653.1 D-aspartate oxidase isoform X2 [Zootermopsis nevadensis]XP_021918654.1 D-aspartate oxidase isoform X2 [Zootermopsis nevadensis]XP_021918655.1 D-aspartate oxidase isoform X2 [Zootermopsis nevadensis]KDR20119.1 D-aspartate oxidase [Zootermopsis nevadensis]